jgi:hypothetical protein
VERGHALDSGRRSRAAVRENPIAAWLRRPRRRRDADALLRASGGGWESHSAVAWRVAELTSPHERMRLARAVEGVFDDILDPRPTASVLVRRHVRTCAPEISAIADLLGDLERPVTGTGLVLVRDLLADGTSPLYDDADGRDLCMELVRIRTILEAA